MSDRQALIARLRKWANNTDWPSEADVLLAAATALEEAQQKLATANDMLQRAREREEAQGVPREPTPLEQAVAQNRRVLGLPPQRHAAAPAAPTRDEQDARRYRWLRVMWWNFGSSNYPMPAKFGGKQFWEHLDAFASVDEPEKLDAAIDAALAEPKR